MLNGPTEARPLPEAAEAASNVVPLPLPSAEPEAEERLPRRARAYIFLVFALGLFAIGALAPQLDTSDMAGFAVLAVLAMAFGRTRITIYGDTTISIAVVGDIAIALLFGPAGSAIISPLVTLSTNSGGAWYKRLFNVGSDILVNVATASVAWALMGGGLRSDAWAVPITCVAVIVYYVLNASFVTLAVGLATRTSIVAVWREKFEWLLPHYVVFGLLGLAVAVGYDGLGYIGLLAFIAPPVMMRFSLKQYLDKTEENVEELKKRNRDLHKANRDILGMAAQLRDTYDGTLEALVSALDARDRETKGHSIRVAKYMMEVAYHMGIKPGTEAWIGTQRGGPL